MIIDQDLFAIADEIAEKHAQRSWFRGVDLLAKIRLRSAIYSALETHKWTLKYQAVRSI